MYEVYYCGKCMHEIGKVVRQYIDGPRDGEQDVEFTSCDGHRGNGACVFIYLGWDEAAQRYDEWFRNG